MWCFTTDGFFSVVRKDCEADELLVRTRQKSDLINLGKKLGIEVKVQENAGSDYRFRAVMKKTDWTKYLADMALELDYPNFKATIAKQDSRRHDAYLRFWRTLFDWHESLPRRKVR